MRASVAALLGAALLLGGACGGSPAGPGASSAAPLRIATEAVVALAYGQSLTLPVESGGRIVTPSSLTWTTSDQDIVGVDAGILTAARNYGAATVTARSPQGETATVRVWVQPPEHEPSTYRIALVFEDGVHETWREAYRWAAERLQRVIRVELPPFALNGLTACAFEERIPPQSGTESGTRVYVRRSPNTNTGFPCVRRPGSRPTTVVGVVTASHSAFIDLDSPLTNLRYTAVHEILHVLGLVGITYGIDHQAPWLDKATSRYVGAFGLEGYRRKFGAVLPYLEPSDLHWAKFQGEVMTSPPTGTLTTISVGALMDIGYPAAWYGADAN